MSIMVGQSSLNGSSPLNDLSDVSPLNDSSVDGWVSRRNVLSCALSVANRRLNDVVNDKRRALKIVANTVDVELQELMANELCRLADVEIGMNDLIDQIQSSYIEHLEAGRVD